MTALWRKMPWFKWFFSGTLTKNDVGFVSDQHIVDIHIPILILHAKVLYSLYNSVVLVIFPSTIELFQIILKCRMML